MHPAPCAAPLPPSEGGGAMLCPLGVVGARPLALWGHHHRPSMRPHLELCGGPHAAKTLLRFRSECSPLTARARSAQRRCKQNEIRAPCPALAIRRSPRCPHPGLTRCAPWGPPHPPPSPGPSPRPPNLRPSISTPLRLHLPPPRVPRQHDTIVCALQDAPPPPPTPPAMLSRRQTISGLGCKCRSRHLGCKTPRPASLPHCLHTQASALSFAAQALRSQVADWRFTVGGCQGPLPIA